MLLITESLTESFLWVSNLLAVIALALALKTAAWKMIIEVPLRQHLLAACICGLMVFWLMDFKLTEVIFIHPMIITAVTLMVGFRFAIIVAAIATLGYLLLAQFNGLSFGIHLLLNGVIPALFVSWMVKYIRSKNPGNLFFYTLGIGFFGSALTVPLVALCGSALLTLFEINAGFYPGQIELEWVLLLMFPEAFINGVVVSSITVFFPGWMKTFDEDYFFSK